MKKKTKEIIEILRQEYPDAKCELNHKTSFQLLVATILSAQTTDKSVNKVTETLFEDYPTVEEFLTLSQQEIESKIKRLGLYRNKAKNLYTMVRVLQEKFNGQVPSNMIDLQTLAGVGRKTANVVLSNAFDVPAIAVDTHVFRVSNRIGIVKAKNVLETEKQLQKEIDKNLWTLTHHLIIFHGRRCCEAKKPKCDRCPINKNCNYFKKIIK